jgi:hypothetical protein
MASPGQQTQQKSLWVVVFGIGFGVFLVLGINSLRLKWNNSPLALQDYARPSLNELISQKEKLLTQLRVVEDAIAKERFNSSLTTASNSSFRSVAVSVPKSFPQILSKPSRTVLEESTCKYSFRVYVYPIPKSIGAIQISEEARRNGSLHVCRKCILEQFALEYIVYDFFQSFCGRTMDPEKADFFYLPLVRDAEFRYAMQIGGIRSRAPSLAEQALLNMIEKNNSDIWKSAFQVSDRYWFRKNGADHIIAMPAPVTNLRHETSKRGFFHYLLHLKPPIFVALEYSRSFVEEYPVCAKLKNIVAPYPTTDPDFYNSKLLSFSIQRDYLIYYAGGLHGDCIEIRKAMRNLMVNSSRLHNVIPPVKSNQHEREHGFLGAKFCPIPVGDSPSSKRMYDVLNFGCIPVVISDDLIWAFSEQTGGPLNHSTFSLQLPQSVVQYSIDHSLKRYRNNPLDFGLLPSGRSLYSILEESKASDKDFENGIYVNPLIRILRRIPESEIEFLRTNGKLAAKSYHYYEMNKSMEEIPTAYHFPPDGGAMEIIASQLEKQKVKGIDVVHRLCHDEIHKKKHKYVHRYPCENDKVDSLIRKRRRV